MPAEFRYFVFKIRGSRYSTYKILKYSMQFSPVPGTLYRYISPLSHVDLQNIKKK
jgi:hypothetical protein